MLELCPECKNKVSESATTCPHCGYRLVGHEQLVTCPRCMAEVLPEIYPHDTISRYCPICNTPVTGLRSRKTFFILSGFFAFAVLVALATIIFYVLSMYDNIASL